MNVNDFNNVAEIADYLNSLDNRNDLSWSTAVELSIRKFQLLSTGQGETGASTCACCFKTRASRNDAINCHECIIYDKTGETGCDGTPYYQVTDTQEGSVERLLACAKEIEFLDSLKELAEEKNTQHDIRVGSVVVVSNIEGGIFQGEALGVVYGMDSPTETSYPIKLHIYSTGGQMSWKSFGLDGYELRGERGSKISKIIDNINDH